MKLTIIGAGPGGYSAAFAAAKAGGEVTLVERAKLGGTCLHTGCIPTKTLRSSADVLEMSGRLAEFGIKMCIRDRRNALEMAERANRAKSDFLSRMSHDIRTPMNAIMGMLSIAKESWDDPDRVRDCLDKVENSARFLLALINDILDMSKIESGKAILKKKAFDFAAFTRNLEIGRAHV